MTSPVLSKSTVVTLALGAGWLLSGACGGRNLVPPRPDGGAAATGGMGDTGMGGAGTAGTAGTGTAGGTGTGGAGIGGAGSTGTGGQGGAGTAGQGGAGTAGQGGAGGIMACGPCPALACDPGFTSTVDPAACCPVCKPIVCNGACAIPRCDPGSFLAKAPGQCCATCMPGVDPACTKGQADFASFRQSLLEKYNEPGCNEDSDCTLIVEVNRCDPNVCPTVVSSVEAMNAVANLTSTAEMDCATCPDAPVGPLPQCPALVALCSNGKCIAAVPAR
jgi:hypothetical protein